VGSGGSSQGVGGSAVGGAGQGGQVVESCSDLGGCQSCVDCVLAALEPIGSSSSCDLYDACVDQCGGNLTCQSGCAATLSAGATIRTLLDQECTALCGLDPACE
jgi:hypothetical protein